MLRAETVGKLAITFITYGFKHGAPREADLSFDVRFLPNPHYEAELRELTGLDADCDRVRRELRRPRRVLRAAAAAARLPAAGSTLREGKSHLTIGIGCTGGRHRSVVIAEQLARVYGERDEYLVDVVHRDIEKPPRRP